MFDAFLRVFVPPWWISRADNFAMAGALQANGIPQFVYCTASGSRYDRIIR